MQLTFLKVTSQPGVAYSLFSQPGAAVRETLIRGLSSSDELSRAEQRPNESLFSVFALVVMAIAVLAAMALLASLLSRDAARCPEPPPRSSVPQAPPPLASSGRPLFASPVPSSSPFPMASMQQFSPNPAASPPPAPPPTPPVARIAQPRPPPLEAQPSFEPSPQPTAQWLLPDYSTPTLPGTTPMYEIPSDLIPDPRDMLFPDPRAEVAAEPALGQMAVRKDVGVIGFCRAGSVEIWDSICGSGILGNSWDFGQNGISVAPFGSQPTISFGNAEAAYQALALWDQAVAFRSLGALQAQQLARDLADRQDTSFSGHGGSWQAMLAVLRTKFRPGSQCAQALRRTGDAFLVEHDGEQRLDRVFSGDGTNWLGLQLMLLRDELHELEEGHQSSADRGGVMSWTEYAAEQCAIDFRTGAQQPSGGDCWQAAVRSATSVLLLRLILHPSTPVGGPPAGGAGGAELSFGSIGGEKQAKGLDWGSA